MPTTVEYNRNYYLKNKDRLVKLSSAKKYCDCCDKMLSNSNFSKHLKSDIHIKMFNRFSKYLELKIDN